MRFQDLENSEIINNIYILKGDDYICEQACSKIISKINVDESSISVFDEENFDVAQLVSIFNQFSFFSPKRVVVIKNKFKELLKSEKNILLSYEKNPNKDCVIIIYSSGTCFDFFESAEVVDCKPSQSYIVDLIKKEFTKLGKQIDDSTCQKLSEYCLSNLTRLNLEINKIASYLGDKKEVNSNVVDLLVYKDTELKIFDLTDAVGKKDMQKSISSVYNMLSSGETSQLIISLLAGQFRRMMFAKINKTASLKDLANALGCKEYALNKAKQQASLFTARALKEILAKILEVDYAIKSGEMSQNNAVYYLIFEILNIN